MIGLTLLLAFFSQFPFPGPGRSGSAAAAPLYYGYGCSGTSTNTCTVGSLSQALGGFTIAHKITTGSAGGGYTIDKIGIYVSNAAASPHNTQGGLFADSSGPSGAALCSSSSVVVAASATAAWLEVTPASCPTLSASTSYWVGVQFDDSNLSYYEDTTTPVSNYTASGFGSWGSASWSAGGGAYSMYVKVH